MKLRLRHNSIRLRLTKTEVQQLAAGVRVAEHIGLGADVGTRFTYSVETAEQDEVVSAKMAAGGMAVSIPHQTAVGWATTDLVAIRAEQDSGTEKPLQIVVEKDFACLEPRRDDDDEDTFPHPEAKHSGACA